jgi:hypothetical protein
MAWALRLASLILVSLAIPSLPAQAEELQVGPTLVCDTQQQVERFVALYDGDAEAAASSVNDEAHDTTACGMATVVFMPGPTLATARSKNTAFQIVEILVIGRVTPNGVQAVEPVRFFSVLEVEEREA